MTMKPDPAIERIRKIRHEISAEVGHDPQRFLEFYAPIQQRIKGRLVNYGKVSKRAKAPARAAVSTRAQRGTKR